ncbi:MAG: exodeoxyribonuclease VII large subunit [Deltaproteobacteria bacterium]|nr:exodeoxyribonuclease VII large subunit [Candidatus Zymogenaceae bacterium]
MQDNLIHTIWNVSDLTSEISDILESSFPFVWVQGEISGLRTPSSGHIYFTLKDDAAQIRAVLFRHQAARLKKGSDLLQTPAERGGRPGNDSLFPDLEATGGPPPLLEEGRQVVLFGRLGVYAARGEYQIIVETVEPVGMGAVTAALEELKRELFEAGYFDESRKKPIPTLPSTIALVTSPTGAALFDMIRVIYQRMPGAHVVVVPCLVQGEDAPKRIAEGIETVNAHGLSDVIIVGRGGGSFEDLLAFNTKIVADAIYNSDIPVISAVGHEIDVTISDLTADVRAATPTAAAQMVVPRTDEILMDLDEAATRLIHAVKRRTERARVDVIRLRRSLGSPAVSLAYAREKIDRISDVMTFSINRSLQTRRERLFSLTAAMDRLSPLGVLSRGYAIVIRTEDGRILRDAGDIQPGDRADIRLMRGSLVTVVEKRTLTDE